MRTSASAKTRTQGPTEKEAPGFFLEYLHKDLLSKLDGVDRKIDNLDGKVDKKIDNLDSKADKKIDNLAGRVESRIEKQTRLMLWIMGAGFTGLLGLMTYLHSDTKQDIQRLDSRIDKLESGISENRKLLIQLIQTQAKTGEGNTSRR